MLWPVLALAQSWPTHPITILMGFPAGSGVDVVARLLQEPMEKSLHGKIVTDYRIYLLLTPQVHMTIVADAMDRLTATSTPNSSL